MNALVQSQFGAVAPQFASMPVENDLGAGVEASYGLIKYRGKVWSTQYKGEKRDLMRPDGDGPRNSIDVVIVKAPKVKSKIYYAKGFVDGSAEAPDCWSTNGLVPDPRVTTKVAPACVTCPMNKFGSRITESGKQGKACSDSKRVAIVPANPEAEDVVMLRNEALGGPMLLRVPAATLEALANYGELLKQGGYPYYSVITRVSFDPAEAYPKFTFKPMRPLTPAEADVIIEQASGGQVERILAEGTDIIAAPAEEAKPKLEFAAPLPTQTATQAAPASNVVPLTPAPTPPVTPAVTAAPASANNDFEKELDALLS